MILKNVVHILYVSAPCAEEKQRNTTTVFTSKEVIFDIYFEVTRILLRSIKYYCNFYCTSTVLEPRTIFYDIYH